ncbi:putative F-box protein At3g58860 [Castanea sativa]|uniref:putative F-box protein At3g58860 n=1 Tax=Castanea sativa TaxID=21020 RepID=UPI003F650E1E
MNSKRKKFTVDDDDDVVVDRISELPEDVLQHILSFLPTKQVFQSTLLSTRWKYVWTTFPILKFDKTSVLWSSETKNDPEVKIMRLNFYKFLNKCLRLRSRQSQRPHIKSFTLKVSVQNHKSKSRVDRWIRFVVKSNVEELILFFGRSRIRYPLPHSVLVAKFLTVLTLHYLKLDSICSDINLPSLKRLSLLGVHADNQIIQNLIFGCPMIEDMGISCCLGIKCIKIFGLPKVMKILVQNNQLDRLELEASDLHDLCINEGRLSELNLLPSRFKKSKKAIYKHTNCNRKVA